MKQVNRRDFLRRAGVMAAGVVSLPSLIPSTVLGATAPSNRVTLGCIGVGWQGTGNMQSFLGVNECQVVAVCDIDENHKNNAKRLVDDRYKNNDCEMYHNFEDVIARKDIDALSLGLPDHWHAIPAVAGLKSGKDIFGEKPLSKNWYEGKAIVDAVARYGRIWQTGSWQRSINNFRQACEIVLNGRIGKIKKVEVGLPSGHADFNNTKGQETFTAPPKELDYDRWLGPSPWAPYCPARVHKNWRWNLDYGGGQLMDWVGHHVDIAHWGLGFDATGPAEVSGVGEYPSNDSIWNTATKYWVDLVYPNGMPMVIAGGYGEIKDGTKWIGEDGWVWCTRGAIDAYPKSLLRETFGPDEINLYRSPGHTKEFIQSVKSRRKCLCPSEVAHRSATPGHLGQIAMMLGRRIKWDPVKEEIIGDAEASRLLKRPMRSPWHL